MKLQKTNAMRLLDKEQIPYEVFTYAHGKEAIGGTHVAELLQQNPDQVFKTLVTIANTKEYLVFVIPVAQELDLKKCAKAENNRLYPRRLFSYWNEKKLSNLPA